MIKIKTWYHVLWGVALSVVFAVLLIEVHLHVNYAPELREKVHAKALMATVVITMLMCSFIFTQMRKTHLLTVELQRLIARDRLTNVATRDHFFERMSHPAYHTGVSLMVDIDNFKKINDTYGHLAGDIVIRRVAAILRKNIRAEDIVCRFGGEEFVIFLSNQTLEQAYRAAERMRCDIGQEKITAEDVSISTTVSIGGAHKERMMDIATAIRHADEALYRAKRAGRNQTTFADAPVAGRDTGPAAQGMPA